MSSVIMSPEFKVSHMTKLVGKDTFNEQSEKNVPLLPGSNSINPGWSGRLFIMSGAKPTAPIVNIVPYASNILLRYDNSVESSQDGLQDFIFSSVGNPYILSTVFNPALATDVATWFILGALRRDSDTALINNASAFRYQIIGTVGLSGSGADMTIEDTNLIQGKRYRINNYTLTI